MSQIYLVERFASPVTSAHILDVQQSTTPVLAGRFVVKVPDGIPLDGLPTRLGAVGTSGTLLNEKAAGYLLAYPGFTRIATDDLMDTSSVDLTNSKGGLFGQRNSITIESDGVFRSQAIALTGGAPVSALVTWDFYNTIDTDNQADLYARQWQEIGSNSTNILCTVSFNGGSTFINPVLDSASFAIAPADRGTSFIFQLVSFTSSPKVHLGSWSVLY